MIAVSCAIALFGLAFAPMFGAGDRWRMVTLFW